MKQYLVFPLVVLSVVSTCVLNVRSQTTPQASNAFQTEVRHILAQYANGSELYRTCDVFARKVNFTVARKLGLMSEAVTPLSSGNDTSLDVSRTTADENEPNIAINRKHPNIIVGGANDAAMTHLSMPAYLTTDAGNSWKTYRLPPVNDKGSGAFGDPMLISDDSGIFYYAFLVDEPSLSGISDIMIARSTDGKNWTLGKPVVGNIDSSNAVLEDKETIAVDHSPASPFYGRLYVAWTEYYIDSPETNAVHYLAYSDDHGATWSKPQSYTDAYGYFALMRIGKDGTIFIASSNGNDSQPAHGLVISKDGGKTFTENPISDFIDYPPLQNGYNGLKGNGFRAFPYVCFDVDPTNNKLYAVYGSYDDANGDAAEYETTSADLGTSWTDPVQIGTPDLIENDHFMPWVNFDPIERQVFISMYSSEEDTVLNLKTRIVRCNFNTPDQMQSIGNDLFNPLLNTAGGWNFIGDYMGADAYASTYAAVWTENRQPKFHDGDIFAYVYSPLLVPTIPSGVTRAINTDELDVSNFSPNPVTGNVATLSVTSSEERAARIQVFDPKGSEVLNTTSVIMPDDSSPLRLNITGLSAGVFRVLITTGDRTIERNLVVLR